jgi:hypothetical protein
LELDYGYGPATERDEGIAMIRAAVERGVTLFCRLLEGSFLTIALSQAS